MSRLGEIEARGGTVEVDAAATLREVEEHANRAGMSLGPLSPGAMELDLARFVEGPYAGLRAIPGGRLEPVPLALQVVLSDGRRYASHPSPRSAAGPDLDALFLGGEGHVGRLASATLRLLPKGATTRDVAYLLDSPAAVVEALRASLAEGCAVASVRVEPRGNRLVCGLRLLGTSFAVDRDVASTLRCFGAGAPGSAAVGRWGELRGPEVELDWHGVTCALAAPASLYRLSLASVVARGEAVEGLSLSEAGVPWAARWLS
jgi:FAD/FMN-containing dehydrogenase